ncbi:maintenance of ploidy protein MOB1 [Vigna unguiculata]|uniref:Maintenance of ploidy protein MOB1 n=1 Tax=Vigna unguiculata TaxID=3917 RepID=A0A4D6M2U3_VIGUN|nr:maintenance of ploidy protein MOB1 [Vigna unguiculata]
MSHDKATKRLRRGREKPVLDNHAPKKLKEYNELCERVVHYAQGIPLVLKVLAGHLRGNKKEVWESELDKLKGMPHKEVYDVMTWSFYDLDRKQQQIFLTELKEKSLITVSKDNFVSMHDNLQDMAWEIVRQESIEDPGRRSRLWDPDDIYEALKSDKLHILAEGLQFLATELRFIAWLGCPLKSLPENFSAEKLVILKLPDSNMEKLWDGVKNLVNLIEVDLSGSEKLKELPDLSKATNLEVLYLGGCSALICVHPSIFSLAKLKKLELWGCVSLTTLTSNCHLGSLSFLDLDYCKNLTEFSVISENMEELRLERTKVKALPSSFEFQSKLRFLDLAGSDIESLPSSLTNLNQLLYLEVNVKSCISLHTLPELPPFLKTLNAVNCRSLKTALLFPSTTAEQLMEDRKHVLFGNCSNLDEHSLEAIGLNAQINLINFVNRHTPTPNHAHFENYYENLQSHDPYEAEAVYVYPGSTVPEWLEYKTMKDYIIIDLSSAAPPLFFAFIFCFVLGDDSDDDDGGNEEGSVIMYMGEHLEETIESDTVCVKYDRRCSEFLNSRAQNQARFKIKVAPKSQDVVLKGFGVSPISTSAYSSFIQQMELRDSMFQFH